MPAPLLPDQSAQEPLNAIPVLNRWARGSLLLVTAGLVTVFAIAVWLNPYEEGEFGQRQPRRMETHTQLGLPPCTFKTLTHLPCPSCGMTTSFSLLMHGDVLNSLRANAVGTLLATFCLLLIPWSLACVVSGRLFFIVSLERALTRVIVIFLVLMLVRWVIVLGLALDSRWHLFGP